MNIDSIDIDDVGSKARRETAGSDSEEQTASIGKELSQPSLCANLGKATLNGVVDELDVNVEGEERDSHSSAMFETAESVGAPEAIQSPWTWMMNNANELPIIDSVSICSTFIQSDVLTLYCYTRFMSHCHCRPYKIWKIHQCPMVTVSKSKSIESIQSRRPMQLGPSLRQKGPLLSRDDIFEHRKLSTPLTDAFVVKS